MQKAKKIFTLFCVIFMGVVVISCTNNSGDVEAFNFEEHNLLVAGRYNILNYEYNSELNDYELIAEGEVNKSIIDIAKNDEGVFAITGSLQSSTDGWNELIKLNQQMEVVETVEFDSMGALAVGKDRVYISADEALIVLDNDLNELGRVTLEFDFYSDTSISKNAHDMIFYKDEEAVYLLDNVVMPVFICKVNVEDPGNPEMTGERLIADTYPHLDDHWLDLENNQWVIVKSYGHRHGNGQELLFYSLDEIEQQINEQVIYENIYEPVGEEMRTQGKKVIDSTSFSPIWALIESEEGMYLSRVVGGEKDEIVFENEVELQLNEERSKVKKRGDFVFVSAVGEDSEVKVFSGEGQNVREILDINFVDDIKAINNVVPY